MQAQTPTRSDSDVLLKELKLKFGEKAYTVPVLRMREAAKWREEFFARTKSVSDSLPGNFTDEKDPAALQKAISRGVMGSLIEFPDRIPELVFCYAPSLPKDEIMEVAYDQDFSRAFAQIWEVAFAPFLASLGMVLEMQRATRSSSPSSANTN
jgi:hypothetical protein